MDDHCARDPCPSPAPADQISPEASPSIKCYPARQIHLRVLVCQLGTSECTRRIDNLPVSYLSSTSPPQKRVVRINRSFHSPLKDLQSSRLQRRNKVGLFSGPQGILELYRESIYYVQNRPIRARASDITLDIGRKMRVCISGTNYEREGVGWSVPDWHRDFDMDQASKNT